MVHHSLGTGEFRYLKEGSSTVKKLGYQQDDQDTIYTATEESVAHGARGVQGSREKRTNVKERLLEIPLALDWATYADISEGEVTDNGNGTYTINSVKSLKKKTFKVEFKPLGAIDDTETIVFKRCFFDVDENFTFTEEGKTTLLLRAEVTEDTDRTIYEVGKPLVTA